MASSTGSAVRSGDGAPSWHFGCFDGALMR
jgi:hypothetical protein